jgi:hypothetical protein
MLRQQGLASSGGGGTTVWNVAWDNSTPVDASAGGGGQPGHQRRRVRESWAVASRHDSDRRSSSNIKPNRPHGGGKG